MVQMRRHLPIPMPTRSNVEIPLHLIPLKTAIDPARIRTLAPAHPRALGKLPPRIAPHFTQNMVHTRIVLLRAQSVLVFMAQRLVLVCTAVVLVVALLHPQRPAGVLAVEQVAREDAVAGGVLDVDVQRVAGHVDDDVEVELELVRDALFHAEVVLFCAAPPCFELREAEDRADCQNQDCPLPAAAGRCRVGSFGFCWTRR